MSKQAWISAGKVSAAAAAVALMLGVFFQGQAQQRSDMADVRAEIRSDMADVRAEIRSGFAGVNERFAQVDARFAQVDARFAQVDDRFVQVDQRFAQVNGRLDGISRDLGTLRERVARIEGHFALPADAAPQANTTP